MTYDPLTGLTGGLIPEPDYPETCQHCPKPLRRIAAGWVDPEGFLRCRKDVDHQPMPRVHPYPNREEIQ